MTKVREEVQDKTYYKEIHFLYEILNNLKDVDEVKAFFKDMLKRSELIMLKRRWHIASLLFEGLDIRTVALRTHTGTHTVTRIKQVLEEGHGGLLLALRKVKERELSEKQRFLRSKKTHGSSLFVKGWFGR